YAHTGTFSVKLLIDDKAGNKQSVTKSITVGAAAASSPAPAPTSASIKAVIAASCTRGYCAFNAKDSSVPAGASSYNWSFGDGVAATALSLQHHYSKIGTYSVRLQIVDKTGHQATTTRSVTIKA
ncbi:MAG: PKD domain-containing protein, partial [Gemmatimonadaceae bacterium]